MIVYIVTAGTYSDYEIRAVFTDKAKAEKYLEHIKICDPYEGAQVEEWSTEEREEIARKCWRSDINLITGELEEMTLAHDGDEDGMFYSYVMALPTARVHWIRPMEYPMRYNGHIQPKYYAYSLVSQEHANKLVIEARQEFLRRVDLSKVVKRHGSFVYDVDCDNIPDYPPFLPEV